MGTITILNPAPYKEQPVPELNKKYHMFDDILDEYLTFRSIYRGGYYE